jgi:hypothetical protein
MGRWWMFVSSVVIEDQMNRELIVDRPRNSLCSL